MKVTKKELYEHPMVVKRILEEVEIQRGEKFEDLEFLDEELRLKNQAFGFTWFESKEGADIWNIIYYDSNFQPFNEFHEISNQTTQVVNDAMKSISSEISQPKCVRDGVVSAEKTQIDPNDLKEGDVFYNALYGNSKYKVVRGDRGDLYGLCEENMIQISLKNSFNSFTPYNIVTGGATFERPVIYPKEGEVCFMKSSDVTMFSNIELSYVNCVWNGCDFLKSKFNDGTIITAETYFKLVNEYNSKLKS